MADKVAVDLLPSRASDPQHIPTVEEYLAVKLALGTTRECFAWFDQKTTTIVCRPSWWFGYSKLLFDASDSDPQKRSIVQWFQKIQAASGYVFATYYETTFLRKNIPHVRFSKNNPI